MFFWYVFFYGPPAIIITLIVSLIGVIRKRASLVLLGAILSAPFSLHISMTIMTSFSRYLGSIIPLTLAGAFLAIRLKVNWLSYVLLLPLLALFAWVTKGIFTQ